MKHTNTVLTLAAISLLLMGLWSAYFIVSRVNDQERLHIIDPSGYGLIISRSVKYVHRLQNIIYLLTGQELTIKS